MSDLPLDLVEEILSRVPLTALGAVKSTCQRWNAFSKDRILCRAKAKQQFLGFMLKEYKVCSMRFNLHGILSEDGEDFVDPSIKEIGNLLSRVEIFNMFHCDGLLLCVTKEDNIRLVVWNPYLGQTRWIEPSRAIPRLKGTTIYALGYDHDNNNHNHKIMRFQSQQDLRAVTKTHSVYEIYDLKSKLWRILGFIPDWDYTFDEKGVSLKGNTYFFVRGKKMEEGPAVVKEDEKHYLLCFDFTKESFGPPLPLPFHFILFDTVTLSSVREEQLAVLYKPWATSQMEIWVTTKIEPNGLLWSNFLKVDLPGFTFKIIYGSFFIDQEKKLAVVFEVVRSKDMNTRKRNMAYITGENGFLRKVDLVEALHEFDRPLVCSYVPSLVQIN